jgi:enterochelin esterase-like enzyme
MKRLFVCLVLVGCGDDDRSAVDGGGGSADAGSVASDSGGSMADAGELTAPATSFCECSRSMPLPSGGAFSGCATTRADGIGTYYAAAPYMRTADAETQPGVPMGTVTSLTIGPSTIYPGVTHSAAVYVPAQYDGSSPAALLVLLDGSVYADNSEGAPYRAPTVLDNLIAEGAMPVTIAVFVDEGFDESGTSVRSLEYDTPDDRFARFVHDELLPATVSEYSITTDPNLRAIGGRSSGGCASWGVAWFRTDSFALVYTTVGSFTRQMANARGEYADIYPMWVDSMPRKPIRVTLLSGVNDLTTEAGVWSEAHTTMTTALDCAGYAYRSGFGDYGHDDYDVGSEFGRDLRFLFANAR